MSIATVYAVLHGDTTTKNLVSDNIGPNIAPQSTALPFITIEQISMVPSTGLRGDCGLDGYRMHVNCWAVSYQAAKPIGDAVRAAMQAANHLLESVDEALDQSTVPGIYRISQQYLVWV